MKQVYLISKISVEHHSNNEKVAQLVDDNVFIPHKHNPYDTAHCKLERSVFTCDLEAMIAADYALVAFPIGEDCAAEVGWFCGNAKPVYGVLRSVEDYHSLERHWMVKGFLSGVICMDAPTYTAASRDKILKVHPAAMLHTLSAAQ